VHAYYTRVAQQLICFHELVITIESRLLEIVKSIQSLESTVFELMWQFQFIPTTMGNSSLKGNASTPGHNATPMEDSNTLLEKNRGKNGCRV